MSMGGPQAHAKLLPKMRNGRFARHLSAIGVKLQIGLDRFAGSQAQDGKRSFPIAGQGKAGETGFVS